MKHTPKLVTVAYAMPTPKFNQIVKDLDKMFKGNKRIEKIESGSPKDYEGHAITYKLDGRDIFFGIVLNSERKRYLVRADDGLIEAKCA